MKKRTPQRQQTGAIAAEYVAAIMFLFLVLTFPLMNLATVSYKYNLVVNAVHNACHVAMTASSFDNPTTGIRAIVPRAINAELGPVRGITINKINYRINHVNIKTQVVTNETWKTKLATAPNPDEQYSIEVVVEATCEPVVQMSATGFIPPIPGLTAPARYVVSSQQLVENLQGLTI